MLQNPQKNKRNRKDDSMRPGQQLTLSIDHQTDFGYFLTDGEDTILLHNSEITEDIEDRDEVEVFIYVDQQERLAATMKIPVISADEYGWVEVVDTVEDMGVFVDVGLSKDALVATEHLPPYEDVWPQKGDKLYCMLKVTNRGRMFAKLAPEDIISELFTDATEDMMNKELAGTVYRLIATGSFVITDDGIRGFIHPSERKEEPRLGSRVTGRVIQVKEDGSVNMSLLPRKQDAMSVDAEYILTYMRTRNGAMPYSDKSQPDDIRERFNMSKAAFKRALGHLMKNGKVYQEDGWTYEKK
ncbi:S1 RNA-binding domain-containing protein [Bacillus inaquosorum]|uniref:CvfB family protein n=1 Tax=Bacillus inaquosorum TaxID=483913 RepID=UPI002282F2B1|nr:S1 RNA-binding domain-containing protein [Bacillus inaquosorum]MCY9014278.1 S1 RNA-binding domain-containing protein [Bacillus inaquosorum]MCY9041516.1 S1 RNA-binding domain-containing protein [Bacillus inaquosorum]MCY9104194.1 S1 RNA-binding domain-containing protein [Bacillus inaquosorum]MCY9122971.1 S1 RNA-binding domain-containing protein [Bacillus inaquosorum]